MNLFMARAARLGYLSIEEQARFRILAEESYPKVRNLAGKLISNRADAEDLTQEAFFRAYRGFHEYHGDRPFENWVFRILVRLFYDFLRSKNRRLQTLSIEAGSTERVGELKHFFEIADNDSDPETLLFENMVSEKMEKSLLQLKKSQRLLVYLADVEQMPYKDIAEITGVAVGTVRSRLHRAHKQLRVSLGSTAE